MSALDQSLRRLLELKERERTDRLVIRERTPGGGLIEHTADGAREVQAPTERFSGDHARSGAPGVQGAGGSGDRPPGAHVGAQDATGDVIWSRCSRCRTKTVARRPGFLPRCTQCGQHATAD